MIQAQPSLHIPPQYTLPRSNPLADASCKVAQLENRINEKVRVRTIYLLPE